ncbi:MAG: sugar phosphate isomerase/epimerase [Tannerellaceae bacterium]|jgi:sugar phosphate isomerase/epimerase|nr:sugar phosphate isomerase/epimerase [Tannerellaceae bacterium]
MKESASSGMPRRSFVKWTAAAGLATLAAPMQVSCVAKDTASSKSQTKDGVPYNPKATLRLSFQESVAPGDRLDEKLDFLEELGVTGFEPEGGRLADRVKELQQALAGRTVQVSAICAGFEGFLLSTEESIRRRCTETTKTILAAAGELGAKGVILVPGFNGQTPALPHTADTREQLCEQLHILGDFAHEHGTTLILEPLNRREAFFLRQVADAASFCRDVDSPGLRCMGDFWHMTSEEPSDAGALLSAGAFLQHLHIASRRNRIMPGEDGEADNYTEGFRALKVMGYDGYISFECGYRNADRKQAATDAVALICRQWEEA